MEGAPLVSKNAGVGEPLADVGLEGVSVALLRGINVGGKNRLPMKDLVAMFLEVGCEDVRTYIQSGNVLFRGAPAAPGDTSALISALILDHFGYQIPVVTRTAEDLKKVGEANPFVQTGAETDRMYVMFLADEPESGLVRSLDPDRSPGDEYAVLGREIYLHCPNGIARSKLTNGYFDSRLATTSTTRNWKTTLKLVEMATSFGGDK